MELGWREKAAAHGFLLRPTQRPRAGRAATTLRDLRRRELYRERRRCRTASRPVPIPAQPPAPADTDVALAALPDCSSAVAPAPSSEADPWLLFPEVATAVDKDMQPRTRGGLQQLSTPFLGGLRGGAPASPQPADTERQSFLQAFALDTQGLPFWPPEAGSDSPLPTLSSRAGTPNGLQNKRWRRTHPPSRDRQPGDADLSQPGTDDNARPGTAESMGSVADGGMSRPVYTPLAGPPRCRGNSSQRGGMRRTSSVPAQSAAFFGSS
jgi:hypothetical protein